jgi:murein DD-endopeptidase MepM/ murein hydrolase activator NlpD
MKRLIPHVVGSLFFGIVLVIVFFYFVDSPKEKQLKREKNEILANYQFLNKELDDVKAVLKDIQYRDDNIYRTIFEAEPLSEEVRKAGFGGSDNYQNLRHLDNNEIVANTTKRFDIISKQLYVQSKSFDEIASLAQNKDQMIKSVPAILPISSTKIKRIGHFGMRRHPIYGIWKLHEGTDFTAKKGTQIHATGDGIVEEVKTSKRGYGNQILINHGFGYKTRYAHLSKFLVKEGQKIKRGDVIGLVGNTGLSTGPHLHYEVRKNGQAIDPINFYFEDLTPEQYDEMIKQSTQPGGQSLD